MFMQPVFHRAGTEAVDAADTGTGNAQNQEEDDGSPVSSAEIDFLLAKISNTGVNSLTPREYKRLRRVREAMRSRTNE